MTLISCRSTIEIDQLEVYHEYRLLIEDIDGHPVEGATVAYILKKDGKEYDRGKFITKSNGVFIKKVYHTSTYPFRFSSGIICKTSKEGYFTTIASIDVKDDWYKVVSHSNVLNEPTDNTSKMFLSLKEHNILKDKIFNFLDMIIVQSPFSNAELKVNSMDLINFKENKYLRCNFLSNTTYDSLKMNKYDIGKILFDEVVRKVLEPLNKYISDPKLFYGYDLIVSGFTKNITDNYSTAKSIEYRFLIPQEIAKWYENKDISGQRVLDSSVILMNDKKIELKIQ